MNNSIAIDENENGLSRQQLKSQRTKARISRLPKLFYKKEAMKHSR